MKRILCVLLSCCLLFALSACGTEQAPTDSESNTGTSTTQTEKTTDDSSTQTEISDSTSTSASSSSTDIPATDGKNDAPPTQNQQSNTPVPNKPTTNKPQAPAVTTPPAAQNQKPQTEKPSKPTDTTPTTPPATKPTETNPPATKPENEVVTKMNVSVNGHHFTATLADNDAVKALVDMMKKEPIVIQMSDYAGFEKVGPLGTRLPASNSQTTTHAGDIVLYNSNQIVIFYGSNSWSYTRLGKIDDLSGWEAALGSGDVTVTFSID